MSARGEDRTDWARVEARTEAELATVAPDCTPPCNGIDKPWYTDAAIRKTPTESEQPSACAPRERRAFKVEELSDTDLSAITTGAMDPRHLPLNAELK